MASSLIVELSESIVCLLSFLKIWNFFFLIEQRCCMFNFQTRMLFVETHYTLATEEAERIGVDHVARLSNTGTVDASTGLYSQSFCTSAKSR